MVTANCIRKTAGGCLKEKGKRAVSENMVRLLDRYRTEFPVETDCGYCYNIIYNSVPISLHAYLGEIAEKRVARSGWISWRRMRRLSGKGLLYSAGF